ncbi:TPA: exotoxin, partial [Staphylococcus aureus]|nr:exotoxin [Staphylococcus aureus]
CMYGGITLNENNTNNRIQPIVVKVYENDSVTLSFDINIDKETVTIQELDYKVRNKLISKINLYHLGGTSYETGYIKFIENANRYYWYDMMPDPSFTQSKYLMIYRGNETVESAKTEIEVHLTKK